jgi:hypothetical protein
MKITINRQHCLGGRSCGQCRQFTGDQALPDYAYRREIEVQAGEELLIQCPKLAIMEVHDGSSE